jgi:hypothetical protein
MLIAIASENDVYDGAVFELLLSRILDHPVTRWKNDMVLRGHTAVVGLAEAYLRRADAVGIHHALFVVDNDGGSRSGPEHEADHDQQTEAANDDGCRTCRVLQAIPSWWKDGKRHYCVAVPVQTLETWLLFLRGDPFPGEPEKLYHRRVLKDRFFGKPLPPEQERARMAIEQVRKADALERLRHRRSFRLFEEQLSLWR